MAKVYGFKIDDVLDFISPEKVMKYGEKYIVDDGVWNVMSKRQDERYKTFWKSDSVSKVILGVLIDSIFQGKKYLEGELVENTLIIYTKNMDAFSEELSDYLRYTPNTDIFQFKILNSLAKISKEEFDPNSKEIQLPVEFGFYDVG